MNHCYHGQLARIALARRPRMERPLGPPGSASASPDAIHVTGGWRSLSVDTGAAPEPTSSTWRSSAPLNSSTVDEATSSVNHLSSAFDQQLRMSSDRRAGNGDFYYPPIPYHPRYHPTSLFANSIRGNYFRNNSYRRLASWPAHPAYGHTEPAAPFRSGNYLTCVNGAQLFAASPAVVGCRSYIAVPGMDKKERSAGTGTEGARPKMKDYPETTGNGSTGERWQQSPRMRKKYKAATDNKSMLTTINELRQWNFTSAGTRRLKKSKSGVEFTIMSYNVLAQCLLEDNIYLYCQCDEKALDWNNRRNQLLREFVQADADILCLQEIQGNHYNDFYVPELRKLGYVGTFKKRTGNKLDGCALFYKRDKFVVDSVKTVEFCQPEIGTDLARDNIAQLVTLQPRHAVYRRALATDGASSHETSGTFIVANTHLLFNPGRGDIRLTQLRILLAEIDRAASQPGRSGYRPIVLCGDMNSEPHCPLHRFVSTGELKYEGLISGEVSGQSEGVRRGRFQLTREFVPRVLGISDQCRYVDATSGSPRVTLTTEGRKSDKEHAGADAKADLEKGRAAVTEEAGDAAFGTGTMSHRFNLVSAYNHTLERLNGQSEVTTHHCKSSSTVDYIFYSVEQKDSCLRDDKIVHNDVKEGELALLGTYGLLSAVELDSFGGLPNRYQPSDHLPLIARFLLKAESD